MLLDWHDGYRQVRATLAAAALAACAAVTPLGAQEPGTQDSIACDGLVVSGIDIVREEPRLIGRSAPKFTRPVLRFILAHSLTKDEAVAPFLLLEPGDQCSAFRLAESARVLRAQPYLADAKVTAAAASASVSRRSTRSR